MKLNLYIFLITAVLSLNILSLSARKIRGITRDAHFSQIQSLSTNAGNSSRDLILDIISLLDTAPDYTTGVEDIIDGLCGQINTSGTFYAYYGDYVAVSQLVPQVQKALLSTPIHSQQYGSQYLLHLVTLYFVLGGGYGSNATAVLTALFNGITSTKTIKAALKVRNDSGSTPLHYAALASDYTVLSALKGFLNSDDDWADLLGIANMWGCTPLHYATANTNCPTMLTSILENMTASQRLTALKAGNARLPIEEYDVNMTAGKQISWTS